jgi:hypothetical protein
VNNWITIKTVGTRRNRDALGARIKVVAEDLTQTMEARSGGSYISQSDSRIHFGLGKKARIDLIEIRWPDGKLETIKDAPINQFVVIEEGKGIIKKTPPARSPAK